MKLNRIWPWKRFAQLQEQINVRNSYIEALEEELKRNAVTIEKHESEHARKDDQFRKLAKILALQGGIRERIIS